MLFKKRPPVPQKLSQDANQNLKIHNKLNKIMALHAAHKDTLNNHTKMLNSLKAFIATASTKENSCSVSDHHGDVLKCVIRLEGKQWMKNAIIVNRLDSDGYTYLTVRKESGNIKTGLFNNEHGNNTLELYLSRSVTYYNGVLVSPATFNFCVDCYSDNNHPHNYTQIYENNFLTK